MIWATVSGLGAGWVLGFLGAGGTVVALPVLLYFTAAEPHLVLGTNAAGVAIIAAALATWRIRSGEVILREAALFALPGLAGIYLGTRLGLSVPGAHLIFLLGILVFAIAGWIYYLSTQGADQSEAKAPTPEPMALPRRALRLVPAALGVGFIAGFFAIGGGFMIVPGLMLAGDLSLAAATASGLLPIACFAGLVALRYLHAGAVAPGWAAAMAGAGLVGGAVGIWLNRRLPRRTLQRAFAVLLVFIGLYMIWR